MILLTDQDAELNEWQYTGSLQDYLQGLVYTSTFDEDQRQMIETDINNETMMDEDFYNVMVRDLLINQLDRITSGMSYNQGDISAHLKKLR